MAAREGNGRKRRWLGKVLRGGLWVGLSLMCAIALRDAVLGGAPLDCQEAVRRSRASGGGGQGAVEAACREQYFARRDPDDGLALARALLLRGELRGAAAVAQGLLLTPARADSLLLLSRVAVQERRFDEAERALALAAELHERLERRREAAQELLELGALRSSWGRPAAALRAFERADRLARQVGDAELVEACEGATLAATGALASGGAEREQAGALVEGAGALVEGAGASDVLGEGANGAARRGPSGGGTAPPAPASAP